MPLILNSAARRLEYTLNGRIVFVVPLPGGKTDDVQPDQVFQAPPETIAKAERYLNGDEAAGDELEAELETANQLLTKREAQQQNTKGVTQVGTATGMTPNATQGRQTTAGLLPSPVQLAAQVDVLSDALSLEDARAKQDLKIQQLTREAQRRGMPVDINALFGNPQAGIAGRFGNPNAIAEAAATNPDYLRIFGGIANLSGVTELRRRDNILAGVADQIDQQDREQTVHDQVSAVTAALDDLKFNFDEESQSVIASAKDGEDAQRKLNALHRRMTHEYGQLIRQRDRLIEQVRPGWTKWQEEGVQNQINALPEGQRHMYSTAGRYLPGWSVPNQPTDRTDPNNPDQKQPVFPTAQPTLNGGTPSFAGPASQPAMATPAQPSDQPPNPAPQGFRWVKEGDAWTLRKITEYEREPEPVGFSGGAFSGLPGFAAGGMFESGAFGAGGGNNFTPPPTAGMAPGMGQPNQAYRPPNQMAGFGPDFLPLEQGSEYQDALQAIEQGYEAERQALMDMHRHRMAMLYAEHGIPMGQQADTGQAMIPGQAIMIPGGVA